MLYFDPVYFVFVAPAILLALWAQFRVKSTYAEADRYTTRRGLTGAEAARRILAANGLDHVGVDMAEGVLSDHYDPANEVVHLSQGVYHGRSLAAVGIAAHEVGHALQKAQGYAALKLRTGLVPLAATGSRLSVLFITLGIIGMYAFGALGVYVLYIGIALFATVVVFQVVNLPVEFDASRRARAVLVDCGIVSEQELEPVARVLNAAALTYVAATLTAVMQLVYYLYRSGLLGGRRD
ncbi:MAG: zinc metallopeptidase [Phycisphaerae bacterium]|nr:zinc metallopeptidase [Phycisphaerae bacterium]